jgi:type II secretory pathway pseudopilin PulG
MKFNDKKSFLLIELIAVIPLFILMILLALRFIGEAQFRINKSQSLQKALEEAHRKQSRFESSDSFHQHDDQYFRKPEDYVVRW